MGKLTGQSVLIVGGSSGIGKAIARQALAEDAEIWLASRSLNKLNQAARDLNDPVRVHLEVLDSRDQAQVAALFKAIPMLDHLVITASQGTHGSFSELPVSAFEEQFASKLFGPYRIARHALARLQSRGSITFFSGVLSQRPSVNCSALASVNAAVEGLTRALALELGPRGIRVNCISPGMVATEAYSHLEESERRKMFAETGQSLPVGRIGTPDEIAAGAMLVLVNGYMTGQVLILDGGHLIRQ